MKYPIGIQSFDRIIEDGYVYVDKTAMVYSLVKERTIYFLSRPPAFREKSVGIDTEALFFRPERAVRGTGDRRFGERLCPSVSGRPSQTLPHRCELLFRNGNGGGLGNGGISFLSGKTGKWVTNQGCYSASFNRYFTP